MATLTTSPYTRFFNFLFTAALVVFAVTTIALYSDTRRIAHKYPADESTTVWKGKNNVFYWPFYISYSPDRLILSASIISLIAGLAGLVQSFVFTKALVIIEAVVGLASLGTSMGALIHGMSIFSKYKETTGDEFDVQYEWNSVWTTETWTCALKDLLVVDSEVRDYSRMCKDSKAARFMTIPLFVLSLLFLITTFQFYAERKMKERNMGNVEMGAVDTPPNYTEKAETAA